MLTKCGDGGMRGHHNNSAALASIRISAVPPPASRQKHENHAANPSSTPTVRLIFGRFLPSVAGLRLPLERPLRTQSQFHPFRTYLPGKSPMRVLVQPLFAGLNFRLLMPPRPLSIWHSGGGRNYRGRGAPLASARKNPSSAGAEKSTYGRRSNLRGPQLPLSEEKGQSTER